jgi:hypothetical protein
VRFHGSAPPRSDYRPTGREIRGASPPILRATGEPCRTPDTVFPRLVEIVVYGLGKGSFRDLSLQTLRHAEPKRWIHRE